MPKKRTHLSVGVCLFGPHSSEKTDVLFVDGFIPINLSNRKGSRDESLKPSFLHRSQHPKLVFALFAKVPLQGTTIRVFTGTRYGHLTSSMSSKLTVATK